MTMYTFLDASFFSKGKLKRPLVFKVCRGIDVHGIGLASLEGFPEESLYGIWLYNNTLTSLEGIPKSINGGLVLSNNSLTSLAGIHLKIKKCNGAIHIDHNPIESSILGLLKIDGLNEIFMDDVRLQRIMNKHLCDGQDILDCAEELIEAGYEEYAQL